MPPAATLERLIARLFPARDPTDQSRVPGPIRGELLGADRLAARARSLATSQRFETRPRRWRRAPLLARLADTQQVLLRANDRLTAASENDVDVGPAGEWLLDNYHVVQEHVREVRASLPHGYYRELPELTTGTLAGYPRVYEIATTLIAHSEGRIDLENTHLFIGAFQEVSPLALGELWAIPAMLRLGLIENVRRMALRTVQRLDEVELADRWAARLLETSTGGPLGVASGLRDFVNAPPPLTPVFVARFLQQLRQAPTTYAPLAWLEAWIADEGLSAEEAGARSAQRLALTQVTTANSITSLRVVGRMDWRQFVERQSRAEAVLRGDPTGDYARMTFATRDHYRHVVERIAKRAGRTEPDVAREAVRLAAAAAGQGRDQRQRHVGYWLIAEGARALERTTGYRPTLGERTHRWVLRHPNVLFFGGILVALAGVIALLHRAAGPYAAIASGALVALALIPASDVAVTLVNQLVAVWLPPRVLPKLELHERGGIPPELRTAVVIPTLFGSVDAVREGLDTLEVRYLANREPNLHFAILSDFTDSATETRETDAEILRTAIEGVRALNARYAPGRDDAFYLFHRPRLWNEAQGVWMGWERKRGKLAQFNRFIRGEDDGSAFSTIVGDVAPLKAVRYVITLDSDTILPPDAAPLLVGTIAHPLNRAVFDPVLGRVVEGYGIIQPRVGVSLPSAHKSLFAAIHSGHPGVDPYTTAVSDVYQDLFGEGSFTGKGIYDVDAFESATHGRFPENTLLSHDLIEGNYARAGLATDIEVYDDYPTRYLTYTRRKHRWIRGDWQLLEWLTPRVPGPAGSEPNRLSALSRWKIVDNLRRSLVEITQLLLFVAAWTILPGSPVRWTLIALGMVVSPWAIALAIAVLRPPFDKSWRAYYASVWRDAIVSAQQVALALAFLPHQAWVSADAVVRTLWRLFVSKRKLLEWQTASQTERIVSGASRDVWRTMWPTVALALAILAAVIADAAVAFRLGDGEGGWWRALAIGGPTLVLWISSPAIAHALSRPAVRRELRLVEAQTADARRYALLHWRFFERFVDAGTSWLAPDNFQDDPEPVVAMRTSPTNIGLQLLSTVSAYDLGFITIEEMTTRLEHAFRSLERLRRFRGHFFNWYALDDLRVLEPAYVSTVDSGNLAGHLLALRQACLTIPDIVLGTRRTQWAIDAALAIAADRLGRIASFGAAETPAQFEAVAAAARAVRDAQHALAAKGRHGFDTVAEPLLRARDTLLRTPLDEEIRGPAVGWIDWSLRRIESARSEPAADGRATLRAHARSSPAIAETIARLEVIAHRAAAYAMEMDFRFLFDEKRKLFSIGYHAGSHQLDASFYDLLASEARLASFVAIAKNDIPVEHWFRLGRTLTHENGATAMVSWSGSMFEYLMPLLVMQTFPFTLLDQTYHGAVKRQIAYAARRNVPWGISECAYNVRDRHFTYQYRAFGVPDLALKRGLGRDLVIAPYASALAVMVEPTRALANLIALDKLGALGEYGFRDALDFTRPDPGETYAVVRNYMAHHVGMGLVALSNALTMQLWQQRFHADPIARSAELLLHERVPRRLLLQEPQEARTDEALPEAELDRPAVREVTTPGTPQPVIALLGHLPYTIMVSACGSGYARYEGLAVTRWRADGTRDNMGQFAYVRDVGTGRVWSAGFQPTCVAADWYRAHLATDRITIHRADGVLETRTEIAVVPEDSAEVRRVTITNNGAEPREVELTSYGEIVIAPPDADRSHPAFSNLFVETEWHAWCTAITATRRPRSAKESRVWLVHVVDSGGEGERVGPVTCDTDRARFVGRGRTTRDPVALDADGPLGMSAGAVLDPIFALRTRIRVEPGKSASVAFTTLVATTRERCFELADRYHHPHAAQRALDLAWTSTQVELRELGITPTDAAVFQEFAGHLLYATAALRAPQEELEANHGSQPLLWKAGVSGDWPLLLATIDSDDGLPTLRQLLAAHHYWRRRGMMVDLVVLNTRAPSYLQDLTDKVTAVVLASSEASLVDRPGGVFIRRTDILGEETLRMLRGVARVQLVCDGRSLSRILDGAQAQSELVGPGDGGETAPRMAARATPIGTRIVRRIANLAGGGNGGGASRGSRAQRPRRSRDAGTDRAPGVRFDNGVGGVTADGGYEIRIAGGHLPPVPWVNVIANEHGGCIVSERGAGATWVESGTFYRLTPWHNDPVVDPPSEVLYLRDEESGELWTPTPAPLGGDDPVLVRHDAGYSAFVRERGGIATELTIGLAPDAGVKISLLRLTNRDAHPRRLTLTAFVEWTLGMQREHTQHQVRTSYDASRSAIVARNYFDPEFAGWSSFLVTSEPTGSHTGDRRAFLGRNGGTHDPAALRAARPLDGETGVGLDPCAALQTLLELAPGETREVVVLLGAAATDAESARLMDRYRDPARARAALEASMRQWNRRLSTIAVRTPEPSFDVMVNRWLLYQALSSRMLGRMGLYQSSGAYGFRDQLQDSLAFVYAEPALARAHIVRAAGRQFSEGDVQHWWHPHSGRGVRTRFSDDMAWLPYVVDGYIRVTGDDSVLDEQAPFLTMRQLEPHEHEVYDLPMATERTASVYDHCLLALRRACTAGAHGLPLIGIGDWNDGMNRVGVGGRGESVWLAWFLAATLRAFAARAEARGDAAVAAGLRERADAYVAAVEETSWDGEWYRRAYFDDGTPLGSAASDECRIDSIAQSWSVISGAGRPERQRAAMRALHEHLVREDARLIMLLTPPFDRTPNDPGYIKGYLPGVRENGAQYTHAALWAVLATAMQGDGDRAFALFQMINPLTHARTPEDVATYQVEPYVVAADVYTAPGHLGRGGWTWYTGSASWMYRVAVESILGLTRRGDRLSFAPRVPREWREFSVTYRHGRTTYRIDVHPGATRAEVTLDGAVLPDAELPLVDDGGLHTVVFAVPGP